MGIQDWYVYNMYKNIISSKEEEKNGWRETIVKCGDDHHSLSPLKLFVLLKSGFEMCAESEWSF